MIKIAHISDLHFHSISMNPFQIFSKRFLGTLNAVYNRKEMDPSLYLPLIDQLEAEETTHIIISGDVSTTSHPREFAMAKAAIDEMESRGMKVFVIPGNHDTYTRKAERLNSFYNAMGIAPKKVRVHQLEEGITLVLLDTTKYMNYINSGGHFTKQIEADLRETLKGIADKVILVNHFPFFQHEPILKRLVFGDKLQEVLREFPQVFLYLHGHTHRHTFADLREDGLPIVLDSGSLSDRSKSTFNMLELSKNQLNVHTYRLHKSTLWINEQTHSLQI